MIYKKNITKYIHILHRNIKKNSKYLFNIFIANLERVTTTDSIKYFVTKLDTIC